MSERAFFSLRYALPGYTFILMAVLVYPELVNRFLLRPEQVTLSAAFLAFLSLLGGGALGFLVSQVWYAFFNHFMMGNYLEWKAVIQELTERYRLNHDKNHRYHRIVFADYVHHLNKDKEMKRIVERRYDLMHLSGSTLSSVFIGSIFGALLRSGLFFVGITPDDAGKLLSNISIDMTKMWTYDIGVLVVIALLLFFLFLTLRYAMRLHAMPFEILVRQVMNSRDFPPWKARRVFPSNYFRSKRGTDET